MALGRLKSVEAQRYYAPGEWGKLLGLDRAPEVRTLRIKLKHLADQEQAFSWSSTLCKEWMLEKCRSHRHHPDHRRRVASHGESLTPGLPGHDFALRAFDNRYGASGHKRVLPL